MELLNERYSNKISGILNCYDRIVIKGTLPTICYSAGMARYLYNHQVRLFDYPRFAEKFRDTLRANAEDLSKKNGLEIIFIRSSNARKEDIVKKNWDGNKQGLVCILSAMEACKTYSGWHDKISHKTFLKNGLGKCLHYYFYFNDPDLGLGYVRVPTWCPFMLQVYFNGHNWLASELKRKSIGYSLIDNAYDQIADFTKAQKLADGLTVSKLHKKLDWMAGLYCPVYKEFDEHYHWSIMQTEYATDIVFKDHKDLSMIYDDLISTAIHTVKPDNIATFLGQKLHGNYEGEIGNNYHLRIEGSRIKHVMGSVSIKMYDKFKKILRIETTVNNVSQFKHYRTVEHRDGTTSQQQAAVKKNIYSLEALTEIFKASNRRYLEFISAIEDHSVGKNRLDKVTSSKIENDRKYRGFNFFEKSDLKILQTVARGEFNINGFKAKDIKSWITDKSSSQLSRILKRLRVFGLIKRVRNTYKYYLTIFGKMVITLGLKLKNMVIIPQLNLVNID